MRSLLYLLPISLLLLNCNNDVNLNPIERALASKDIKIKQIIDNITKYEVQIQLSEIKRLPDGIVEFTDHQFHVNDSNYYYPASSVKFPIAVLALEKINTIDSLTSKNPFMVEGDSIFTTIRDNITKIFAVSDNVAYNNLYEFLGRDYINSKLKTKGLKPLRISHRLSTPDASNPVTKSLIFQINDSTLVTQEPIIDSEIEDMPLKKLLKGKGFYSNTVLVNEPMDFSEKNYLPITTIHDIMKRIQFPENFSKSERFNLNKEDYTFLLNAMNILPKEAGYISEDYYDGYVKFFMYGDTKESIPDYITIANKVGYAYGYLTDCAYIKDSKHNIEYILTATIHVNEDGIFNDDVYEYDTLGIPFLAELGRQIHENLIKK